MPQITDFDVFVRSTDMDADLIVNNAVYFQYFEEGRLEHMRQLKMMRDGDPARTFTLAETTCKFLAPAYHRDVLTVKTFTLEVRNRSFMFGYEILNKKTGQKVAEGTSAQVWLDESGRPTPLPPKIRISLEESI